METLKQLHHRDIVRLYDFSLGDKTVPAYMVLELVDGRPLYELMERGVPFAQLLSLVRDVLEGLGFGHARGVVHRDVKPDNILVTRDGIAKLTDYGIARHADQATLTAPDKALGTPSYMAPEQAHPADRRPRRSLRRRRPALSRADAAAPLRQQRSDGAALPEAHHRAGAAEQPGRRAGRGGCGHPQGPGTQCG